jgi:two-component system sensor kinase FixL
MDFPLPPDFEAMANSISHCILVHAAETKDILWANSAACSMLGFSLEELKPLKAPDMSSGEKRYRRAVGRAWLQRAVDNGESQTQWKYKAKNGHEFLTDATAKHLVLSGRSVIMVEFRDIESELTLKRRLNHAEELLQTVMENTSAGILLLDRTGRVVSANPTAPVVLGRPLEELVGLSLMEISVPRRQEQVWQEIGPHFRNRKKKSIRLEIRQPDGSYKWLAGALEYIRVRGGTENHVWVFHDVTDRVEAERRDQRSYAYANYLGRQNAMGDMAMTLAHELAQPLAAANNFLAGVQSRLQHSSKPSLEKIRFGVENSKRQLVRASEIVNSVQRFAGSLEMVEQLVDLNEIVRDCLYFIQVRADEKNVHVETHLDNQAIFIKCERILIGQVILNLCFNAIDEMSTWEDRPRVIDIYTHRRNGQGIFCVEDQGKGLSHIPNTDVFAGAFTSKSDGHGVGLALSYRIITRQGGAITATDNAPHGAVFDFALPLAQKAPQSDAGGEATQAEIAVDPGADAQA